MLWTLKLMKDVNSIFSSVEFKDMSQVIAGKEPSLKKYDIIICDEERLLNLKELKPNAIVAYLKSKISLSSS